MLALSYCFCRQSECQIMSYLVEISRTAYWEDGFAGAQLKDTSLYEETSSSFILDQEQIPKVHEQITGSCHSLLQHIPLAILDLVLYEYTYKGPRHS